MALVGRIAAQRLAAAMLQAPVRRMAAMTALRRAARTAGALPVRARPASSPKVTSRTQWMGLSGSAGALLRRRPLRTRYVEFHINGCMSRARLC